MYHYMLYTLQLKKELLKKIGELEQEEDVVNKVELDQMGEFYRIHYFLEGTKEECEEILAHILCDIIQEQVIAKVCKAYLKENNSLSKLEKREITEAFMSNNYLSRQEGFSSITYYLLYMPLLQEIRKRIPFNIDGWIAFRTYKYKVILADLLEQFILDYSMKKEVVSFIKLMRDVSVLSIPIEDILHLIYDKQGNPLLYDKEMKNKTGYYIKQYCRELLVDSSLTREDLILHILLTISPKKLIIHQRYRAKEKQFLKTLEFIFDSNIEYCDHCKNCE